MRELIKEGMTYDEDGNLLVAGYSYNFFAENATYTESLTNTYHSAITNMYDGSGSTFYIALGSSAATSTLKWDFGRKIHFRNIYVVIKSSPGAANDSGTLQGSNDDSSWTSLDTYSNSAAAGDNILSMVDDDITYRYIKVTMTKDAASGYTGICGILGVVKR